VRAEGVDAYGLPADTRADELSPDEPEGLDFAPLDIEPADMMEMEQ
jgi:hypothetical protein